MRRKFLLLLIDLFWVVLSPFIALALRDNFSPREGTVEAAAVYALIAGVIAAIVLPLAGLNRGLWRYASLHDTLRLVAAATVIVLLSQFSTFALSRAEDVARSLPIIQWFVLLALMIGSRVAIRVWQEQRNRPARKDYLSHESHQNVIIVGVNNLTELYLGAIKELAPHTVSVIGILGSGAALPGRLLQSYAVLGRPEDLEEVVRQQDVHGSMPDRVAILASRAELSPEALEAIFNLERSTTIKIDWILERLGLSSTEERQADLNNQVSKSDPVRFESVSVRTGRYLILKRAIDVVGAAVLIVLASPLFAITAAVTALDLGRPLVFWQKRPGRLGYAFKLYKFRTMSGAHDRSGNRIPDEQRQSRLGLLLRRSRLDELPQLYNVLIGEMSFIGPRPLLPMDQGPGRELRLSVRPGLSGWAQVNGGRLLSPDQKAALDIWYVQHMSLSLDIRIAFGTLRMLIFGERIDHDALSGARTVFLNGGGDKALDGRVGPPQREGTAKHASNGASAL